MKGTRPWGTRLAYRWRRGRRRASFPASATVGVDLEEVRVRRLDEGSPLRAVLLDVDGTLYDQGFVRRAMLARLFAECIRRPVPGFRMLRILHAYRRAQEALRTRELPSSDLAEEQVRLAADLSGLTHDSVVRHVETWFDEAPLPFVAAGMRADLPAFLESARRGRLLLGVVSDYPAERKLEALGIRPFFDVIVHAQEPEIGFFKPHPAGILSALRSLSVEPSEAVYVGDRPDVDVLAARNAGVEPILIGNAGHGSIEDVTRVAGFRALTSTLCLEGVQ